MMTSRNQDYEIRGRKSFRKMGNQMHEYQLDGCHNPQLNECESRSHRRQLLEDEASSESELDSDEIDFSSQLNVQKSGLHFNTPEDCFLDSEKLAKFYPNQKILRNIVFVVLLVAILCVLLKSHLRSPANEVLEINHSLQFSKDLKTLSKKFNLPRDFLQKIRVGMNTIHHNESTGSFTILYDSGASNFLESKFNELLNNLANATAKYLRQGNGSFTELDRNDLKLENHEELMYRYDSLLLDTGVMMVKELDSLPTKLAMAFHYFCDEFNPLVKKSAIFFTIDKQKCSIQSSTEPHKWIEKCLANKWKNMQADCISPLLTRVIDIVLQI